MFSDFFVDVFISSFKQIKRTPIHTSPIPAKFSRFKRFLKGSVIECSEQNALARVLCSWSFGFNVPL